MNERNNRELKRLGLKVTGPRLKILAILDNANHKHMSAESIHLQLKEMGEEIGLATVYRVLTQFESNGLVIRHGFHEDSAVFELNDGDHHDHLVCTQCGRVEEFVDESIEARQRHIAEERGFQISDHALYLYGTCRDCASTF